ncbi:hypothetical protein A2311_01015 [candidate division WOR-1 bacterium RIFOXYB2_FULL_48_7]|uniref:Transporter n=1 Tax=candidate division WOR-1 bacterium RIFOXYB2_FULL_48_7 TaxID=1802583 RepID=A0A1F4TK85_UNCSA|nr:MAG: hypothetical protein A2311_01015 [candidate division WOR-1 bacterium RIFOXYB2_FULL_48_7]
MLTVPATALSLTDGISLALKNNPTVLASQKRVSAANAKLNQAIGSFLPTIKLDGSYQIGYTQPSIVEIEIPSALGGAATRNTYAFGTNENQHNKNLSASFNQPLFVGALFPGFRLAQKMADNAKEELQRVIFDVRYNVTQSYFGVLRAEKMVELAIDSEQMASSHLKQVKSMVAAGVATQADFLRAEVSMANAEVNYTKSKNALELARDALNNALGQDLETEIKMSGGENFRATLVQVPDYKQLLQTAYGYRPDWKQFQLTKQIYEETLNVSRTNYLPTAVLTGNVGDRLTEYPDYRSDVNSWAITGAVSWTIFDGLTTQNKISEAQANLEAIKAEEEKVRAGIALEVRDAYLTIKSAQEIIDSTLKAVQSAQESYKVSSLRFSSGVATNLEVIDAQVALTQAKVNHLQALYDLEIAKAKLNKTIGVELFKSGGQG